MSNPLSLKLSKPSLSRPFRALVTGAVMAGMPAQAPAQEEGDKMALLEKENTELRKENAKLREQLDRNFGGYLLFGSAVFAAAAFLGRRKIQEVIENARKNKQETGLKMYSIAPPHAPEAPEIADEADEGGLAYLEESDDPEVKIHFT